MKRLFAGTVTLALAAACGAGSALAGDDLVRELLRQQSAVQREACTGVKRALAAEPDASVVVRSAVEIGLNPCQVIRCAIEGGAELAEVVQGAGDAGVKADVVARCAVEAGADHAAVARLLSELAFEPSFCYVTFSPAGAPEPQQPLPPVIDRSFPAQQQASQFTF